ncbi:MAG: hypothetical protein IK008_05965 [Bacteroidales bacterium]|nr:hypothetical protein [Bacteroidales bacterium]
MKKWLIILCFAALAFAGCRKEEPRSYQGTWNYLDSTPDLGPAYADSWVKVDKNYNYSFYDAPSGKTVEGGNQDFTYEGLNITLSPAAKYEFPSFTFKLTRLKDDLMVVETYDLGEGNPTTIRFSRVSVY